MPIVGEVLDVGRFGGLVVRIGGQSPSSTEVLLPVCERPSETAPNPRRLVRFTLEPQELSTGAISWVGPYEPLQPSPPSLQEKLHTEPCEVIVRRSSKGPSTVKSHVLYQDRCPLRRPLIYQHSLVPSLTDAPRRTQKPKPRGPKRRAFRPKLPSRPPERPQSQGLEERKELPEEELSGAFRELLGNLGFIRFRWAENGGLGEPGELSWLWVLEDRAPRTGFPETGRDLTTERGSDEQKHLNPKDPLPHTLKTAKTKRC